MAVVVDTANVPPDERFSVWSDVSAQVFEPLAVAQLGHGPFAARLEHYGLGSVSMFHMWADASSADRTPRLIRSGDPELFQLTVQLSGACWIAQDDRRSIVRSRGDRAPVRPRRPERPAARVAGRRRPQRRRPAAPPGPRAHRPNLGDPALCPDTIAREHSISRSYVYPLFEDQGASVAETIWTRRLERSRRDLADAALDHESIFDIAWRRGFVSKSHFSRAVRAAYGQAPSDFRRDAVRNDLTTA